MRLQNFKYLWIVFTAKCSFGLSGLDRMCRESLSRRRMIFCINILEVAVMFKVDSELVNVFETDWYKKVKVLTMCHRQKL